MKARLGTVTSNKVQMSRGLPQGAPESPVISHLHELLLRDFVKSWISRKLAWRLDDFTLAAICYVDDVVLIGVSVSAAETMVSEVIEKLKDVGVTVGAQKTHWTSFPKIMDKNIMVDGSAKVWEEVLFGRECKTCDRTQNSSSQQMSSKMETCVEFSMAPQIVAVEHHKDYDVAGLPLELECLDDGQGTDRQNCEVERENGGECCWSERPPGMELGQWWRLWHRTGHPWIEKCNMNVLVAIRDLCSAGLAMWQGWITKKSVRRL